MLYNENQAIEKLPQFLAYEEKYQSPKVQSTRFFVSPTNGNTFACQPNASATIRLEVPTGTYGTHLNTQETALAITVTNNTGQSLTIDQSGMSLISQVDVYFGSTHLSSISSYDLYGAILLDYTGGNTVHHAKGMADISFAAAAEVGAAFNQGTLNTQINNNINSAIASLNNRNGRVIANGASDTFILPMINLLGSLAMKALPIGELKDTIRIELKTAPGLDWGVYPAAPTTGFNISSVKLWLTSIQLDGETHGAMVKQLGGVFNIPIFDVESFRSSIPVNTSAYTYSIPIKVSSLTTIFITLRENSVLSAHNQRSLCRTKSTLSDYRFRIGSQTVPSSAIDCTGNAAEARMELIRAFNQLNMPVVESYISNATYNLGGAVALAAGSYGGFVFALNLSALGSADILSDGRNVRLENLTVDLRFNGNNVPLQMDVFCAHEKLIVVEQGYMSYKN